ncbi:MAG: class I SAM-dependent methyltransferase [Rhodoferax sp.]|nr:class I SAM-dependent methyltransferase [Rhodoferax sp.]
MSKKAEFDQFAADYREIHAANIGASGEEPEYLAAYKMKNLETVLREAQAPNAGRYFDFSCGVGTYIAHFRHRLPAASLLCSDVSEESLSQARKLRQKCLEFAVIKDGEISAALQSPNGAFACCVFHHIPPQDHGSCLLELRRVLRPGAPLMIYEHSPLNPLTVKAVKTCPLDANAILLRAEHLRATVEKAGFARAQIRYRVFFPARFAPLRMFEQLLTALPLGAQYYVKALA